MKSLTDFIDVIFKRRDENVYCAFRVGEFEYTNEMIVFDLLGMRLFHGWLVGPESVLTAAAVGNCTYNQLVVKIISLKGSDREKLVTEGSFTS